MPMNATPSARYCCQVVCSRGVSALQGVHHDAQKLRITGLPFSDERRIVCPDALSQGVRVKSGAACPTSGIVAAPLIICCAVARRDQRTATDRKSTRLNSSHVEIS